MADRHVSIARDAGPRPAEERVQQAVLSLLLEAHPAQRSMDEILREMTDEPEDFAVRDLIDNAVRDLVGAGLAHRHGAFVFATRAAVRFDELQL
jgi:hypothetical protein